MDGIRCAEIIVDVELNAEVPEVRRVKALSNPYINNMKMNVVDHAGMKAFSARNGSRMGSKCRVLLLLVISVAFGAGGCADYYGGYYGARYGPGPYYGVGYGGGYGTFYGRYPGSATV